jgi:hypothetical protein
MSEPTARNRTVTKTANDAGLLGAFNRLNTENARGPLPRLHVQMRKRTHPCPTRLTGQTPKTRAGPGNAFGRAQTENATRTRRHGHKNS